MKFKSLLFLIIFFVGVIVFILSLAFGHSYPVNDPIVDPDTGKYKDHWIEWKEPALGWGVVILSAVVWVAGLCLCLWSID